MMAAVLESLIFLVMESSQLEYETFLLPHIRYVKSPFDLLLTCYLSAQPPVQRPQDCAGECDPPGAAAGLQRAQRQRGPPSRHPAHALPRPRELNVPGEQYGIHQTFTEVLTDLLQVQMAAVSVVPSILDYVGDDVIRSELLPRAKLVHSANSGDVKIVLSLLACIAKVLLLPLRVSLSLYSQCLILDSR